MEEWGWFVDGVALAELGGCMHTEMGGRAERIGPIRELPVRKSTEGGECRACVENME